MKISGTAQDSKPFENNQGIWSGEEDAFYVVVAGKSGTYGPYDLQIWANGEMIQEQITFVADVHDDDTSSRPMEEGFIQSMDFVIINPRLETISIIRPTQGAILTGEVGCEIFIQADFPILNDTVNIIVQDVETGNIISEYEDTTFADGKNEFSGMWGFLVPVGKAFVSGSEYDIILAMGGQTVSRRVTMVSEAETQTGKASEPIQLFMFDDGNEPVGIENFRQGNRYEVNLIEGGYINLRIQGGTGEYRIVFSGIGPEANAFKLPYTYVYDGNQPFTTLISSRAGTYGPVKVAIASGDQHVEYDVMFNVLKDHSDSTYGIVHNDVIMTPEFIETVDEEKQAPVVILSPQDGAIVSGRPGYTLDVSLKRNKADKDVKVELVNCKTGEVIDTYGDMCGSVGASFFCPVSVPSSIDKILLLGAEYEVRVTCDNQTFTARVTMKLEPDPDA